MDIESFHSIEELFERIEEDKKSLGISDNRFPIRFIFLNSFEELKELFKYFSSKNVKITELSNLLYNADTWFTPEDVEIFIGELNKDSVVQPLSEYLRFLNEDNFYVTLKKLTEIEKRKIRIYVPLVGLWERFEQEFWTNFYRKDEWAPIWKLETRPQKIIIYQLNFNFDKKNIFLKDIVLVSNTKEWFNLWKNDNVKSIISLSEILSLFYKNCLPDQTFNLKEISNQKEYLDMILGTKISIKFNENEVEFWNELIKEISENKENISIKEVFLKHFNLRNIDMLNSKKIVSLYLNAKNSYEHWIIKNFILISNSFKFPYLKQCFKNLEKLDKEHLIEKLWLEIFNSPFKEIDLDIFDERRQLLKLVYSFDQFSNRTIEEKLLNELQNLNLSSLKEELNYITDITLIEREFILKKLKNTSKKDIYPEIREIYPEIYYYINWETIKPENDLNEWIIEYLKAYNISKIENCQLKEIKKLINLKNQNKNTFFEWFYSLPKAEIVEDSHCVWIDGLGAEWFPLFYYFLNKYGEKKGKYVKKKMITRVNLPSTTKCNKYSFEKVDDLDKYIHSQSYKHPITLIEEIEILKNISKKILDIPAERICILSDHGLSFLCLKEFGNSKKFDFTDSKHDGRYMWIDEGKKITEYDNFILLDIKEGNCQGKKSIIALKHDSLNNTPYREVHGGATPEEILVPYFLLETEKDKIEYEIEPSEVEVSVKNPTIRITISPKPDIPEAFFNGKLQQLSHEQGNIYNLSLMGLKTGENLINVKINKNQLELKVNVKVGYVERDLI